MDGDDEVAVPMVTRSGVERATAPDNRFPHDEISLDNFSVNRMLLVFKQLEKLVAVKEQQLEAKEKDAKMWQNFSTFKDQLLRDQGDELKTTQHQLEYHRELVKVLQSQLDENKQSMSATNSDDGSDGIFVHRSKGELEVKNNELETKIQKLTMQNRRLEREDVAKHTMSSNEGTEGAGSRSHVETQKDAESDMPTERADLEDHGGHTSDDLYNLPYLSSSSDDEQPDNPDEAVSVYSVSSSDEEKSIDAYEPELPMSTSARRNDTVEDLKPQTSKTGRKSEEAADQKVELGDIAKYTLSEDAGSGSASASASRNDTFEDSKPQTGNIGHKSAAVTGKTDAGGASSSNVESEYLRLFPHGTKNPPKLGMGQTLACSSVVGLQIGGLDPKKLPRFDRSQCRVATANNYCAHCATRQMTHYGGGERALPCV